MFWWRHGIIRWSQRYTVEAGYDWHILNACVLGTHFHLKWRGRYVPEKVYPPVDHDELDRMLVEKSARIMSLEAARRKRAA